MEKGLFITFEGPDGSGKTTILNKIIKKLEENNIKIARTREPGGENKVCEEIRNVLLKNDNVDKYAESLLFAGSRVQHVNKFIIPKISEGINIICDRFLDSSIAYQAYGKEIDLTWIKEINKFSLEKLKINYIFFFDVEPSVAQKRILINPNREKNRFDFESFKFQELVYKGYQESFKNSSYNLIRIDASKNVEEVYNQVWKKMKEIFGIKND